MKQLKPLDLGIAGYAGKYTGRSPEDKFLVDTPAVHDDIAWGDVNHPISKARYDAIKAKVLAYLQGRELFVNDGYAGADPKYTQAFRIVNEYASQNLFMHQLLIRPTDEQLAAVIKARAGELQRSPQMVEVTPDFKVKVLMSRAVSFLQFWNMLAMLVTSLVLRYFIPVMEASLVMPLNQA